MGNWLKSPSRVRNAVTDAMLCCCSHGPLNVDAAPIAQLGCPYLLPGGQLCGHSSLYDSDQHRLRPTHINLVGSGDVDLPQIYLVAACSIHGAPPTALNQYQVYSISPSATLVPVQCHHDIPCLKCKRPTSSVGAKLAVTPKGRPYITGPCVNCKEYKAKFIREEDQESSTLYGA